jgi:hypothetical protein
MKRLTDSRQQTKHLGKGLARFSEGKLPAALNTGIVARKGKAEPEAD